jgi:drug/metabolite transporter (DMT)-like permease
MAICWQAHCQDADYSHISDTLPPGRLPGGPARTIPCISPGSPLTLDWLTLSLFCAFALATSDAAAKYWLGAAGARELVVIRLGLSGLLLLPYAMSFGLPMPPAPFWGWMALLLPLELVAMLCYVTAIRDHPLALTLPYLAFTPVFVVVTGAAVLGEQVSHVGLLGIVLVVVGSWWLNYEPGAGGLVAPFRAIASNRGARLMLTAALIYSLTSVGGKAAMQWMPAEQFGAVYFVLLGLLTLVVVGATRPAALRIGRFGVVPLLVVAGFMALMVVTHFMALSKVEAAYMISAKRTSLLFGMLYGAILFSERHLGRHLVAGLLMIAGVAIIAL